jgi:hypothetical protein
MQFEDGNAEILKGREFDFRPRRNLMKVRRKLGLDLVIVNAQMGLLGGPRGDRDQSQ